MIYKDYQYAAKRHIATCKFLLESIEDTRNTIDIHDQGKILQNTYYLAGYIIECAISHTYFKVIKYDRNKSVYECKKFSNYIRNDHSFKHNKPVIEEINKLGGSIPAEIPIIGKKKVDAVEYQMYKGWNAQARYIRVYNDFDLNGVNVRKFFNLASDIYRGLNKI
jgi:hypothetical protein